MKTKLFTLLFAIVASTGTIFANGTEIDGIYYNLNSSDMTASVTYRTSYYDSYTGNVIVPSSISYAGQNYDVTSIGTHAFDLCQNLTSVTIPNSITSLGEHAFARCYALTTMTIPNSVTSIGQYAFYLCTNLNSINIPDGVTNIEANTFYGCSSLTSVVIPNSVTNIGDGAFNGCSSFTSITIPENVTSIEGMIFNDCTNLTSVVWNAKNCSDFTSADYKTTSTPFYYYYRNSANSNYDIRYDMRSQITSFVLGNEVERIPSSLCWGMSLTSVTIPQSVTSIGNSVFASCNSLTTINIPYAVTSIGNGAFSSCNNLNLVYCELGAPLSINNTTFENASPTIYVPSCAYTAFSNAPVWKDMSIAPVSVNLAVVNNTGGIVVENCGSMEIEAIPYSSYHFKRWQDGNTDNPRKYTLSQSNRNFIAEFEIDKYQITFLDEDETTVLDQREWSYGATPECAIPTKAEDSNNTYLFANWIPNIEPVTSTATYVATYTATPKTPTDITTLLYESGCSKLLRNGQLLILRGEKMYTVDGREVR